MPSMSYFCAYISSELQSTWNDLVARCSFSGFHQSFSWANFKQHDHWETYKIGIFDSKSQELVGGCIVHEFSCTNDTNFLYIPEGPIMNFSDHDMLFWQWRVLEAALHRIVSLTPEMHTTHIRMEIRTSELPSWLLLGWSKAPLNLMPKHTRVVDLKKIPEVLLTEMKQKCRYNIRLAEKRGVTVRKATFDELNVFYALYEETSVRDGFEKKSLEFFQMLLNTMGDQISLYIAEHKGIPLAGAIVVTFAKRATYLYGASGNAHRNLMAPYALHWNIMMDAKQQLCTEYDFWGVSPSLKDETHDWHGLSTFKSGFGGEQINFVGAYDYIFQPEAYEAFIEKYERE